MSSCGNTLINLEWNGRSNITSYKNISTPDPSPKSFLTKGIVTTNGALIVLDNPEPSFYGGNILRIPLRQNTIIQIECGVQRSLFEGDFAEGIVSSPDGKYLYHVDAKDNVTYRSCYDGYKISIFKTIWTCKHTRKNVRSMCQWPKTGKKRIFCKFS